MDKHHIAIDKIVLISTDAAKSMTGVRKGFVAILKEKINHEILVYHQEALCVQTFPEEICKIMEIVISLKLKLLIIQQFKEFLLEMKSEYALKRFASLFKLKHFSLKKVFSIQS